VTKIYTVILAIALLFTGVYAEAAVKSVKLFIDNQLMMVEPGSILSNGQVYVPIRVVAEHFGAQVQWDDKNNAVLINQQQGDLYLKGQNVPGGSSGIMNNLVKAAELKDILDEDGDGELADYRNGRSGGDDIANDPLVVDIRNQTDYDTSHIPGAVWITGVERIAEQDSIDQLNNLLNEHVKNGGKKEIVLYCYTGNTSGLAAGVLGAKGIPVKSMMYGFDIAWQGTKSADKAIRADMEDSGGNTIGCGG